MIVNIKKRYAYFIIGLLVLAIGVFVVNALTPGLAPNPGHTIDTVAPPTGCGDGQVLQFIDEASGWGCVVLPVDTDDQTLSVSGQTLSISEGNSVTLQSDSWSSQRQNCYWQALAHITPGGVDYELCNVGYVLVGLRDSGQEGHQDYMYCCQIR